MSKYEAQIVRTSREAREELGDVVRRFRERGAGAAPLIFGAHRRPEAAIIPFDLYREIVPLLEDLEIARIARARLASGETESLDELATKLGVALPR